jgi:hypothetical protein
MLTSLLKDRAAIFDKIDKNNILKMTHKLDKENDI